MIPVAQIVQWRKFAPWADDKQVEQDLILSRIIVERDLFEKNIDKKIKDSGTFNDIEPLLSPDLIGKYSKNLVQETGEFILTEAGACLATEGGRLPTMAGEIKKKILRYLS